MRTAHQLITAILFCCSMYSRAADVPSDDPLRQNLPVQVDELKVKRESVFEFTEKPVITRNGDTITIGFTTKSLCDVTVAVEDAQGRIVRHLASGVLGPKAPEPTAVAQADVPQPLPATPVRPTAPGANNT